MACSMLLRANSCPSQNSASRPGTLMFSPKSMVSLSFQKKEQMQPSTYFGGTSGGAGFPP